MGPARKILVVDDDPKTVSLVKLYLESDGHKVVCAYDGVEALRLAREERPNLIVLDLMLPGMDGLQVCRTLRTESDVPVIMLTARTTEGDKLTGLDFLAFVNFDSCLCGQIVNVENFPAFVFDNNLRMFIAFMFHNDRPAVLAFSFFFDFHRFAVNNIDEADDTADFREDWHSVRVP